MIKLSLSSSEFSRWLIYFYNVVVAGVFLRGGDRFNEDDAVQRSNTIPSLEENSNINNNSNTEDISAAAPQQRKQC